MRARHLRQCSNPLLSFLLFMTALCAASVAPAEVQPGDVITKANMDKIKDLVGPGIAWCVEHGMTMTIIPTKKVEWPRAYREATEAHRGQVRLSADGTTLENYVAGMPFPDIDVNDPNVANKIMWNYQYKPTITDDVLMRDFQVPSGPLTYTAPMVPEREFMIGDLRRLYYNGRLFVDPKPSLPNPEEVRYKEILSPIVTPFDMKGVGQFSIRYLSAARQDDTWLYIPAVRRARRMSTTQRSDSLFGQDTDADSYWGYSGHIAWSSWKLLGVKDVLAVMHREHFPAKRCPGGADFAFCDNWEKRRAYVIEGISKLPQYAYSKRVLYIDTESWAVFASENYDRRGELWKLWLEYYSFRKQAPPNGKIVYDDEMGFVSGTMIDMQGNHATIIWIPGPASPDPDTWYFNRGPKATSPYASGNVDDVFRVPHLIETGH
ncbi:MAG: outer rane lipoproteinsorting protein [Deltaproteobacteria bacterium]|nr:outer rane lipoproteinsorting protein [Deltaproteobacteria bacterium]